MLSKTIYPEVTVQDERAGICEYVASDESIDSDGEVIRVNGWRFDRFNKNAPFVNSHNYQGIENQLGKVLDARVERNQLIETVQWAIDVPECRMAAIGFAMTQAGYLKAVSVGFFPTKLVTRLAPEMWPGSWAGCAVSNANARQGKQTWAEQCSQCGVRPDECDTIYMEQQQTELSACLIGANQNALAKSLKAFSNAYRDGVLNDTDLELISSEYARSGTAKSARGPGDADAAWHRAQSAFLQELEKKIHAL